MIGLETALSTASSARHTHAGLNQRANRYMRRLSLVLPVAICLLNPGCTIGEVESYRGAQANLLTPDAGPPPDPSGGGSAGTYEWDSDGDGEDDKKITVGNDWEDLGDVTSVSGGYTGVSAPEDTSIIRREEEMASNADSEGQRVCVYGAHGKAGWIQGMPNNRDFNLCNEEFPECDVVLISVCDAGEEGPGPDGGSAMDALIDSCPTIASADLVIGCTGDVMPLGDAFVCAGDIVDGNGDVRDPFFLGGVHVRHERRGDPTEGWRCESECCSD